MRRGLIFGLLIAVVIAAGWWFLVMTPIGERIVLAEDNLVAEQDQNLVLRGRLNALQKVEDRFIEYQDSVDEMQVSVPPDPQMDTLILQLNQLAEDSGVTWLNSRYSVPAEPLESGIREVSIAMTVEGQYFEILGYLYGINEMDRLIRIDGLGMSPSLNEQGFNILSVTVNATTFTTGVVVVPEVGEIIDPTPSTTTTTTVAGSTTTTSSTTTTTAGSS